MPAKKIEIEITGKVFGYASTTISDEEAAAMLLLDAEMRINKAGDIRAHLSLSEKPKPFACGCVLDDPPQYCSLHAPGQNTGQ